MNYDLSKIRIKCNEIRGHEISHENKPGYMTPWFEGIGFGEDEEPIPNVTESADAALQLVEWMAKPENGAYLWFADSVTNRPKYTVSFISRKNATQATADTFPLALCLAFLKANGINPEAL